jgi:2-polyprenyl-6-methoxyphenol hydroxylase-like FAD-dependent oxidoreductase
VDNLSILISGAGIAGLALASALRSHNVKIDIVEKHSDFIRGGAAICLPANATAILQKLGVLQNVVEQSFSVKNWNIYNSQGELLNKIIAKNYSQNTPFISIDRTILHEILLAQCNSVKFRLDCSIKELNETGNKVEILFTDKSYKKYDYVIGADGIYSKTRYLLNEFIYPTSMNATCWRCLIENSFGLEQPKIFLGNNEFMLLHPINKQQLYCGAIAKTKKPENIPEFHSVYSEFKNPEIAKILEAVDSEVHVYQHPIESLNQIYWGTEKTILIGDAAHACAPSMQQGGSQALEDAYILAKLLSASDTQNLHNKFIKLRNKRIKFVYKNSNAGTLKMLSTENKHISERDNSIREQGLTNFNLWSDIFKHNPT